MLIELTTEEIEVIHYVLNVADGECWYGGSAYQDADDLNKKAAFSLMKKVGYPHLESYADWERWKKPEHDRLSRDVL